MKQPRLGLASDCIVYRSGLPRDKLAVLHGCIFEEKCEDCGKLVLRDTEVSSISFAATGNKCARCGGVMRDTLLDWEDELPEDQLEPAEQHCYEADLVLTLGTSLRIEPAGSMPQLGPSGDFVIVNLQETPYDERAKQVIRAPVDVVMETLMRDAMGLTMDPQTNEWLPSTSHSDTA